MNCVVNGYLNCGLWTDNENVMQGIQERMYVIFGKGGIKNVKVFAVLNETMTVNAGDEKYLSILTLLNIIHGVSNL